MLKNPLKTYHAPAIRSSDQEILKDYELFNSQAFIVEMFNALPYLVMVLNKNRQVIFSNKNAVEKVKSSELLLLLGKRPGEILNCIHSDSMPAGCGTSKSCKVCGAVNTILESLSKETKVTNECRITTNNNGSETSFDFEVTATPFAFQGKTFTIFSMVDISSEKRRRVLERIFFHDILNTAGNLAGLIEIINHRKPGEDTEDLFKIVTSLSKEIIEEITSQKVILLAETGDLRTNLKYLDIKSLLNDLKNEFLTLENKKPDIHITDSSEEIELFTDRVILSRILKNMLKNAVEASKPDETITLSAHKKGVFIRFTVHNASFMSIESQLQVFKRNFSTKGYDRGIGTYSMKLLGENYLKGKVGFSSSEKEGTSFYFDHPV